jgi:AcrR family transcriptional regulator
VPAGSGAYNLVFAVSEVKKTPSPAASDIRDEVVRLKRERIVEIAGQLFYSQGFARTTLEAVAERMNMTKPFIYSHFRSKTELLAEISSRGMRASLDAITRIVSAGGSPAAQMQVLVHDFVLAVLDNQGYIAVHAREQKHLEPSASAAISAMRRKFDKLLTQLVQKGVDAGEFRVEDTKMASLAIASVAIWSHVWYREGGRLSKEQVAQQMVALVMTMLQAGAATVRPARRKA